MDSGSSSSTKKTTVYVTGYGPFATVKVNPSTTVGKRVADGLLRRGDLAQVHYTELETSIAAASEYFDSLEKTLDAALAENPAQRFLLFHIGVHSHEQQGILRVETVGYNELHASVPDVRGVVFDHDVIDAADGAVSAHLTTFFAKSATAKAKLHGILDTLNEANRERAAARKQSRSEAVSADTPQYEPRKHDGDTNGSTAAGTPAQTMTMPEFQMPTWVVSTDAGRYLCNYCLYRSLKLQEKYGKTSSPAAESEDPGMPPVVGVFIHVCDPQQGTTTGDGHLVAYNPTIMEQCQQTELVAHDLVDWVMQA